MSIHYPQFAICCARCDVEVSEEDDERVFDWDFRQDGDEELNQLCEHSGNADFTILLCDACYEYALNIHGAGVVLKGKDWGEAMEYLLNTGPA